MFHLTQTQCEVCHRHLLDWCFDGPRRTCQACVRKAAQTGAGVSTAIHGTLVRKDVPLDHHDIPTAFQHAGAELTDHLNDRLRITPVRFYVLVEVDVERETVEGPLTVATTFASDIITLLTPHDISEMLADAQSAVERRIQRFSAMGSGWILSHVKRITLKSCTYNPLGGSSYLKCPLKIERTRAVVNIHNNDEKCFLWAVLAHVHPADVTTTVSQNTSHSRTS